MFDRRPSSPNSVRREPRSEERTSAPLADGSAERVIRRVAVFCGSAHGQPEFTTAARELGLLLAQRGIGLIYGGGGIGLMGAVADAAWSAGGEVIGVIPHALMSREIGRFECTELVRVASMHERKTAMAARADAFLALPGGFGTLEEVFEALTWNQLGIHAKPIGFLNVAGFYDRLLEFLDHAAECGVLKRKYRAMIRADADPAALLEALASHPLPEVTPWETTPEA